MGKLRLHSPMGHHQIFSKGAGAHCQIFSENGSSSIFIVETAFIYLFSFGHSDNNVIKTTFRMAIKYIKHLQYLLSYPPHQNIPSHIVEFDPAHPAWIKAGSGLHPHLVTSPPTFEANSATSAHIIDMQLMDMDEHSNDNIWISNEESPHRSAASRLTSPESPPPAAFQLTYCTQTNLIFSVISFCTQTADFSCKYVHET